MKTMSAAEVHAYCATLATHTIDESDGVTELALAVFQAMICDDAAQARYLEIYGREWMPGLDAMAANDEGSAERSGAMTAVV